MNPWPDDYVEPPDEHDAHQMWLRAADTATLLHDARPAVLHLLGHYLHHLTEQVRALQAVCDEQHAELARRDMEDAA